METIVTAISNIGYPIVCNLLCMWYITKKDEQMSSSLTKLQTALAEVTSAVNGLKERMEKDG